MSDSDDSDGLPHIALDVSASSTSAFEMPDASMLATQRERERELYSVIEQYERTSGPPASEEGSDAEITSGLKKLLVEVPKISIPHENPGVDVASLERSDALWDLEETKAKMLSDVLDHLVCLEEDAVPGFVNMVLDGARGVLTGGAGLAEGDVRVLAALLCVLLLERRTRRAVPALGLRACLRAHLHLLLDQAAAPHHSPFLLKTMSAHLLRLFPHFHDRLVLVRALQSACVSPAPPHHFSNRVSACVARGALAELVGAAGGEGRALRDAVLGGTRWRLLAPYEQYVAVLLVDALLAAAPDVDREAREDILTFLTSLKCSNKTHSNGDFHKVKGLVSKCRLFWQERQHPLQPSVHTPPF